jgi:hypothetical protein
MSEYTPGFYAIELHCMTRQHDISRAALTHNPHNDEIVSEYNATMMDLLTANVRHNLGTDDKITTIEDMAYQYTKMSHIKQILWNITQKLK